MVTAPSHSAEEGAERPELVGAARREVGERAGADDEHRVLGSGHRDVEPVPVEEEAHAPGHLGVGRRRHRQDRHRRLLSLELVDGADPHRAEAGVGEDAAEQVGLLVVGRDDEDVVLGHRPGAAGCAVGVEVGRVVPGAGQEVLDQCADRGGLLRGGRRVLPVVDEPDVQPRVDAVEGPGGGDRAQGLQPPRVGQPGDGGGERGVHPPGGGEEVAELGRQDRLPAGEPHQGRGVDRLGVRARGHLGQLLRVAEQEEPPRGHGDGEGLRQGELPGLVDDQEVELSPADATLVGEVPGGAPDDVAAPGGAVPAANSARSSGRDRAVHPGSGVAEGDLGDLLRRRAGGLHDGGEDVLDRGVALGAHPDGPAELDEPGDDVGTDVRLAGAGRPLDREVGVVHGAQRLGDRLDVGVRTGARRRGAGHRLVAAVGGGAARRCRHRGTADPRPGPLRRPRRGRRRAARC